MLISPVFQSPTGGTEQSGAPVPMLSAYLGSRETGMQLVGDVLIHTPPLKTTPPPLPYVPAEAQARAFGALLSFVGFFVVRILFFVCFCGELVFNFWGLGFLFGCCFVAIYNSGVSWGVFVFSWIGGFFWCCVFFHVPERQPPLGGTIPPGGGL